MEIHDCVIIIQAAQTCSHYYNNNHSLFKLGTMNSMTNKKTKATKGNINDKSQGKRDINNNTALYRMLIMKYDLKYRKNYPQFFSRPPYLYGVTSKLHHSSKVKHATGVNSKRSDKKGNVEPTKYPSESVRKPYYGKKSRKQLPKALLRKPIKQFLIYKPPLRPLNQLRTQL